MHALDARSTPASWKSIEKLGRVASGRLTQLVADADLPGARPVVVVRPVGGHPPPFAGADDVVYPGGRAGHEGRHDGGEEQQGVPDPPRLHDIDHRPCCSSSLLPSSAS